MDLGRLERNCNVSFKNKNLLRQAMVHRSYVNENRDYKLGHNERLEFLGDAVLELAVTHFLFSNYPQKPEGDLTAYRAALVNTQTLAEAARKIGINDHLLLSRGEAKDVGRARQYILANAFEALIGAIYLDLGFEEAVGFISRTIFPLIKEIIEKKLWQDNKSLFQEKAQEKAGITPSYKTLKEVGPDHSKRFTVGVFLGDELIEKGEGDSKQEAEQVAAKAALIKRDWH